MEFAYRRKRKILDMAGVPAALVVVVVVVVLNSKIMAEADVRIRAVATIYQEPAVHYHRIYVKRDTTLRDINYDCTVRRLGANDPDVEGLNILIDDSHREQMEAIGSRIGRTISMNTHLRGLFIQHRGGNNGRQLLHSLFKRIARNRSIEDLNVYQIGVIGLDIFSILAPFIKKNVNLRCIQVNHSHTNTKSCKVPSLIPALLQTETNRLERLSLEDCGIDDERVADLLNTLSSKPGLYNLVDLGLGGNQIGSKGCKALSSLLENSESRVHSLGITLTPKVWQCVSPFLKDPDSEFLALNFEHCKYINDEVAFDMFSVLANNTSLKKLTLDDHDLITSTGWVMCFQRLIGSNSALEKLTFIGDNIDDEGAVKLVDLIARHMNTVTHLLLRGSSITDYGWRAFTEVLLPSSTSKLKELVIENFAGDNNDFGIDLFAALANNNSLNVLDIRESRGGGDSLLSLATLTNSICDKSSIASVWESNHALFRFTSGDQIEEEFPPELVSLMEMNEDQNKTEVARKKILLYIPVEDIVHLFASINTTILPIAIEWIGRDRDSLGFSAMFGLLGNMPSLFEYTP